MTWITCYVLLYCLKSLHKKVQYMAEHSLTENVCPIKKGKKRKKTASAEEAAAADLSSGLSGEEATITAATP